jgi:sortase B
MRNGSMFGSLKRVRNEEGIILNDPYFYYYTPTMAYKCHVFSYYLESASGKTYNCPTDNRTYDEYMDYILSKNEYAEGPESVDLSHRPKVITLSTCSGFHSGRRTVIHGIIEDTYKIGENLIYDESFGDAVQTEVAK